MLRGHARIHKQANYSLGLLLSSPLLMQSLFGGRETRERQILKITKNDVRRVCRKCYWEDPRIPQDAPVAPGLSRSRSLHRARAVLTAAALGGLSAGHSQPHTHTRRLPLSLGYKGKRNAVARGGSCILGREMVLTSRPKTATGERENDAALTRGGRARRAPRGHLPGCPPGTRRHLVSRPCASPSPARGRFISRG